MSQRSCAVLSSPVLFTVAAFLSAACGEGDTPSGATGPVVEVFQTSRAGDKLAKKDSLRIEQGGKASGTVITVDIENERQEILGFGGALTEASAHVLAQLPKAKRKEVIDAYFSPAGAGYTLARTHIASCDFSLASYQYSTTPDPELSDFSIEHDRKLLIPLIKDAMAAAGENFKLIAAPWSAPAWMKQPQELFVKPSAENNYRGVDPTLRPMYYGAYALYFAKYLKAYREEGVEVWGLSPQNEPLGNGGNWETMRWSPSTMATFIADHLGPRLEAEGFAPKIMVYDHNKGPVDGDAVRWAEHLLNHEGAKKYIWGTAFHWYGGTVDAFEESLDAIHEIDPTRALIGTEHTIDGLSDRKGMPPSDEYAGSWMTDEFYWTKSAYDWGYWWATGPARDLHPVYEPVYRYARDIIQGLNHWYVGWIDWNVVLDETGGPNHQDNLCAAPVMVDTKTDEVFYTPLFYVMSHFSKFMKPGAHVLASSVKLSEDVSLVGYDGKATEGLLSAAARNVDGRYAFVLFNQTKAPISYEVVIGTQRARGVIDAQALQTLLWPAS